MIKNFNQRFNVTIEDKIETGLFLRFPVRPIDTTTWPSEERSKYHSFDSYYWLEDVVMKKYSGFFTRLVNPRFWKGKNIYSLWKFLHHDGDAAGFLMNIWVNPFYFKRETRILHLLAVNPFEKILEVKSKAWKDDTTYGGGFYIQEKTRVLRKTFRGNKWQSFNRTRNNCEHNVGHFTYQHVVEEELIKE